MERELRPTFTPPVRRILDRMEKPPVANQEKSPLNVLKKTKRQITARQRQGQEIPIELVITHLEADHNIVELVRNWESPFEHKQGEPLTADSTGMNVTVVFDALSQGLFPEGKIKAN